MQIDRRITNGLAWAGAVLVVAIPVADFAARQFSEADEPRVSVVQEAGTEAASLPTPVEQRPVVTPPVAQPAAETPPASRPAPSAPATQIAAGDAVDTYLESGRQLPSYISDAGPARPTEAQTPAAPAPTAVSRPATPAAQPAAPAPAPQREPVVAAPPAKAVTLPTPLSERPPSVAASPPAAPQNPLIVDRPAAAVVTAEDLEDWETGPLSDFLARRGGTSGGVAREYDPNGFFLDQGPNTLRRQPFPQAYDDEYEDWFRR